MKKASSFKSLDSNESRRWWQSLLVHPKSPWVALITVGSVLAFMLIIQLTAVDSTIDWSVVSDARPTKADLELFAPRVGCDPCYSELTVDQWQAVATAIGTPIRPWSRSRRVFEQRASVHLEISGMEPSEVDIYFDLPNGIAYIAVRVRGGTADSFSTANAEEVRRRLLQSVARRDP